MSRPEPRVGRRPRAGSGSNCAARAWDTGRRAGTQLSSRSHSGRPAQTTQSLWPRHLQLRNRGTDGLLRMGVGEPEGPSHARSHSSPRHPDGGASLLRALVTELLCPQLLRCPSAGSFLRPPGSASVTRGSPQLTSRQVRGRWPLAGRVGPTPPPHPAPLPRTHHPLRSRSRGLQTESVGETKNCLNQQCFAFSNNQTFSELSGAAGGCGGVQSSTETRHPGRPTAPSQPLPGAPPPGTHPRAQTRAGGRTGAPACGVSAHTCAREHVLTPARRVPTRAHVLTPAARVLTVAAHTCTPTFALTRAHAGSLTAHVRTQPARVRPEPRGRGRGVREAGSTGLESSRPEERAGRRLGGPWCAERPLRGSNPRSPDGTPRPRSTRQAVRRRLRACAGRTPALFPPRPPPPPEPTVPSAGLRPEVRGADLRSASSDSL